MSDAFGPRFRASRRATLCLALSASIAIAGCESHLVGGECINTKTGERVAVIDDTGMWRKGVDSRGFEFSFRNTSKEWRCKGAPR